MSYDSSVRLGTQLAIVVVRLFGLAAILLMVGIAAAAYCYTHEIVAYTTMILMGAGIGLMIHWQLHFDVNTRRMMSMTIDEAAILVHNELRSLAPTTRFPRLGIVSPSLCQRGIVVYVDASNLDSPVAEEVEEVSAALEELSRVLGQIRVKHVIAFPVLIGDATAPA